MAHIDGGVEAVLHHTMAHHHQAYGEEFGHVDGVEAAVIVAHLEDRAPITLRREAEKHLTHGRRVTVLLLLRQGAVVPAAHHHQGKEPEQDGAVMKFS